MPERSEDITGAIKELRRRAGMTQQALAVRLMTSVRTVAHWEAGRVPGAKFLALLHQLSTELGENDLASVFSSALADDMPFVIQAFGTDETAACLVVLELLRNEEFRHLRPKLGRILQPVAVHMAANREKFHIEFVEDLLRESGYDRHDNKAPAKKRKR